MPFVQAAWANGQTVRVHGLVYDMQTGLLVNRNIAKYQMSQLPSSLAVTTVSSSSTTVVSSPTSSSTNTGLIVGLTVGIPLVARKVDVMQCCW